MRRREFITLVSGAAAAWPLAARAQQTAKVSRVGILSPAASETAATLTAFRQAIRDLGYIEGQTIALDFRLSKGIMDALPALAEELVRIPVNVIVTDTTTATLAAFGATRTIPAIPFHWTIPGLPESLTHLPHRVVRTHLGATEWNPNAFAPIVRARPSSVFGRPVHLLGLLPLIATRWFSSSLSDPTSRQAPCPPEIRRWWLQVGLSVSRLSPLCLSSLSIPSIFSGR